MKSTDETTTAAVRITSSCFAKGMHLQEGNCYEMSLTLARDLETANRVDIISTRQSAAPPAIPLLIADLETKLQPAA